LSPYPAAWTILQNGELQTELKVLRAQKQKEQHNLEIGTIIALKKELKIAVKKGFIIIEELQLSGKRKMRTPDLLNGYTFLSDAKVL